MTCLMTIIFGGMIDLKHGITFFLAAAACQEENNVFLQIDLEQLGKEDFFFTNQIAKSQD